MALTKDTVYRLTIDDNLNISVARVVRVFEDGELVGERIHRRAYAKDSDISDQPQKIQNIAEAAWS